MLRAFGRFLMFVAGVAFATSFGSPSIVRAADASKPAAALPPTPKFELDVMPVLTVAGCNSGPCHGKSRGQNGFQLSLLGFDADFDYAAIVKNARGRRVAPAAPEMSLLLSKGSGEMPHGGGRRLDPAGKHYDTIRRWISGGMPRTTDADPKLVGVDVAPKDAILPAKSKLQLKVTARYSDGSKRDVTDLAAFQSNDSAVAAIAPGGQEKAGEVTAGALPGETAIMARYMNHIAVFNGAVPLAGTVDKSIYAALPRKNFIDDLVWKRLQKLGITPSVPADDATFLRRAHLDIIGRLPTAAEVRAFLADKSPTKRESLVDALLARPEYADHWANKWADLLRPNPYRVGIKAVLAYDIWIREAFRTNKPYDEFVTELVTARGSTFRNGATVLFRDRRAPEEITTLISQLFLGVRLDCARCHHHPFEVWGQDEFYSTAAYFGQIGYKGTGISPPISGSEEFIFAGQKKGVLHPITGAEVAPKPLSGTIETVEDEEPRATFARWMTDPANPYFSQVAVNRVWAELMGVGIVEPVDDMRATNPPTNPELLAALAKSFRDSKYDLKQLIRTIALSNVYGLSAIPNERNNWDLKNYSRHYRRQIRAETLADAVSDITGVRDSFAAMPPKSRAVELWTHRIDSLFLDAFGRPDPNQDPPCERTGESTLVQSLHLMNAPALHAKVTSDKGVIAQWIKDKRSPREMVEDAYLSIYTRPPSAEELETAVGLYADDPQTHRTTTEDLVWALLNTPEFTFRN